MILEGLLNSAQSLKGQEGAYPAGGNQKLLFSRGILWRGQLTNMGRSILCFIPEIREIGYWRNGTGRRRRVPKRMETVSYRASGGMGSLRVSKSMETVSYRVSSNKIK